MQEFYSSAVRMVAQPLASGDDAHAHERRLGCLMLSCLSCNLPLGMLEVSCRTMVADTVISHCIEVVRADAVHASVGRDFD